VNELYCIFYPPPVWLLDWAKAIPQYDRLLTINDHACQLHFAPHEIIRDFRTTNGHETTAVPLELEEPILQAGAVSSIFCKIARPLRSRVLFDGDIGDVET